MVSLKGRRRIQDGTYLDTRQIKGSIQPRREFANSQLDTNDSTLPAVTITKCISESNVIKNTGANKQLLEVPKVIPALYTKTIPYILNKTPQETKQESSNSGNSLCSNNVNATGDLNAIPSVALHSPKLLIYSRYRRQ